MEKEYNFTPSAFVTRSLSVRQESNYQNVLVEMSKELASRIEEQAEAHSMSVEDFLKELIRDYRLNGQRLVDHQSILRLVKKHEQGAESTAAPSDAAREE